MQWEVLKDKETAARAAGEYANSLLRQAERAPVLLLLAGGSSFAALEHVDPEVLGENATVAMSDERHSTDQSVSNFAQLMQTDFYRRAAEKTRGFIDTRVREGESLEGLATRFEKELRAWRAANPGGKAIMTQGIGPDGHTCGIMPYPESPGRFKELFLNPARWVAGYDAAGKNEYPLRVTVTIPFLRSEITASTVYATGEQKRSALGRVKAASGSLWETPGRILREMRGVRIFTDLREL